MQHWVLGIVAVSAPFSIGTCHPGPTPSTNVAFENQHWVERAPKDARDMVSWLSVVDHGRKFGAAQRRSGFAFVGANFLWKRSGHRITMTFPQFRGASTVTVQVKPYRCQKGIFDRCLDLTWRDRTVTLYSMPELRIRPTDEAAGVTSGPAMLHPQDLDTTDDSHGPDANDGTWTLWFDSVDGD